MNLPLFSSKTREKMRTLGLSESQVLDVFQNGVYGRSDNGTRTAIKNVRGVEIGIYYEEDPRTRQYIITSVWMKS